MNEIINIFLFFLMSFSEVYICSNKAIVLPLESGNLKEPNEFSPNSIVTYYSINNIQTSIKIGQPPYELIVFFDDNDSSFFMKEGPCHSENYYSILSSFTFKYDESIIYQNYKNDLNLILNNMRDTIYLNQANKEYFYLSLEDERNENNLNKIEINDFNFLYPITQEELNLFLKIMNKKKEQGNNNKEKTDDEKNKYNKSKYDESNNISNPNYPKDEDDDNFSQRCGYIGLLPFGLKTGLNETNFNFIQQLKNKGIIDNYNWYIHYNKEKAGELIIGAAPHEVRPENYLLEDLYMTHAKLIKDSFYWAIDFSSIELLDKETNKMHHLGNKRGVLTFNDNFISSPRVFYNNITSIFFKPYLDTKKCQLKKIYKYESIYDVIYCYQNNFTENELKKFPVLYFKSSELNYEFNLDYNDLFIKTKNVYIFKIIYSKDYGYWKLGKTFLEKYQFVFNYDSKMFGFYSKYTENNLKENQITGTDSNSDSESEDIPPLKKNKLKDEEIQINEKNNNTLYIIYIIILIIILILIAFYIMRKFSFSKKVNSKAIENYKKFGKKKYIDNAFLENAEEIK